jgi:hypothetical protein
VWQVHGSRGLPAPDDGSASGLYVIPSLVALTILVFFRAIVWLITVVLVLVNETYPDSVWRLRGIARGEA